VVDPLEPGQIVNKALTVLFDGQEAAFLKRFDESKFVNTKRKLDHSSGF
jgi:hypothetical protein